MICTYLIISVGIRLLSGGYRLETITSVVTSFPCLPQPGHSLGVSQSPPSGSYEGYSDQATNAYERLNTLNVTIEMVLA